MSDFGHIKLFGGGERVIRDQGKLLLQRYELEECCCEPCPYYVPSKVRIKWQPAVSMQYYCYGILGAQLGESDAIYDAAEKNWRRPYTQFWADMPHAQEYELQSACLPDIKYATGRRIGGPASIEFYIGLKQIRAIIRVTPPREWEPDPYLPLCYVLDGFARVDRTSGMAFFKEETHIPMHGACTNAGLITIQATDDAKWYKLPEIFCCLPPKALITPISGPLDTWCLTWSGGGSVKCKEFSPGGVAIAEQYYADIRGETCVAEYWSRPTGMFFSREGYSDRECKMPVERETYGDITVYVSFSVNFESKAGSVYITYYSRFKKNGAVDGDTYNYIFAGGRHHFIGWDFLNDPIEIELNDPYPPDCVSLGCEILFSKD